MITERFVLNGHVSTSELVPHAQGHWVRFADLERMRLALVAVRQRTQCSSYRMGQEIADIVDKALA